MFNEIRIEEVRENIVDLLKRQWGLVTAGDEQGLNMMTVSWGALGELWGKDMVTVYIRPQRYTVKYMEAQSHFTLSFYPQELKSVHGVCGSKSGRDLDKVKATGLTPVFDQAAPYFEEAKLVLVCRKAAKGAFDAAQFLDKQLMADNYPSEDFHYIYYGVIEKVLIKE